MAIRKRTWTTSTGEQKEAWVADYFDQHKRRHIKTFRLKKEADAWLAETKGEVKRGIHTAASQSITIGEAGHTWIAQAEADGLERSTTVAYRVHLEKHIKPLIGAMKLSEFTVVDLRAFRRKLVEDTDGRDKCSPTTAKKIVGSLGSIIRNAMAENRVARNVVHEEAQHDRHRRRLAQRHEKRLAVGVDVPTKEELRALLAQPKGRWRPLIVTAIFTGLRASELRGLRWRDVDLEDRALTVRQRADKWGTIGSPKTASSRRSVPLAPMVVNTLKEWRLACSPDPDNLVFPTKNGRPMPLSNIIRLGLEPVQRAAGIVDEDGNPKYSMHSLRHAAASLFIEQGMTPKRVQALLGHSTIQMTFDTYGHLFPSPEDDQKAMEQLQARLVG